MTHFAENLKFLREQKGFTQAEMLDECGFKQSTWNGYERGTSTPNLNDLIKISDYFRIAESDLLHSQLSKGNLIVKDQDAKNRQKGNLKGNVKGNLNGQNHPFANEQEGLYYAGKMPKIVTVNQAGVDNIIYVPIKAQAGYLIGYEDQEYIESLPSFQMPGLRTGTFRMFEVQGLSMSPTLSDKDRVIAEWVPSMAEIRENRVHVMVLKDGVVIKRVLNRVSERNKLYLKSDTHTHRSDHPIREIEPTDILEIWYVRMKVSGDLSEPSEIYTRLADLEIFRHEVSKKLGLKP